MACHDYSQKILNGLASVQGSHELMTSYQPGDRSVIDYTISNLEGLALVPHLTIGAHEPFWSDHAALLLMLSIPSSVVPISQSGFVARVKASPLQLLMATALDRALIQVLDSKASDDKHCHAMK